MRTRYRHFINVYHWDKPSKLVYKFSRPTSLRKVDDLRNISSDELPKDFPLEFPSTMEALLKKPKRSEGFDYKVVITGCLSRGGKPFGSCTATHRTSGRKKL